MITDGGKDFVARIQRQPPHRHQIVRSNPTLTHSTPTSPARLIRAGERIDVATPPTDPTTFSHPHDRLLMVQADSDSDLARGDPAPDFDLPGVDGDTHSLADFGDNSAVLVVFTCNHCPYAQAKFPLLNRIAAEYDDCAVVGINPNDAAEYSEDSFEKMREYVESGEVAYDAYLRDQTAVVAEAYGAVCTPDPFLLRREGDGQFTLAYHGRLDDALDPDDEATEYYIEDAIDAVLAGEDVAIDPGPSRGCSIKWP